MSTDLTFRISLKIRYQYSISQLSCQQSTAYNTNRLIKFPNVNNHCNVQSQARKKHTICQSHQFKKHIHGKAHLAVAVCKCAD